MENYFLRCFKLDLKTYLELMVGQILIHSVDEQLAAVSHCVI